MRIKYVDNQAVIDLAKTIAPQDVLDFVESHGDLDYYNLVREQGIQRLGQAFMNSLDDEWYTLTNGMPQDPYHSKDEYSVALAVAWLTAQEIANEGAKT